MLQNPFLAPPQVESDSSRSWAMGFAFGFQGPEQSSMTPLEIQPENADAFDSGVLAGQDAAINGLTLANSCVDLHAEGPSGPDLAIHGSFEGIVAAFSAVKFGLHLSHVLAEGVVSVVTLSIALATTFDDAEASLQSQASALEALLQKMGIEASMALFIAGGVDESGSSVGCELLVTPIFRSQGAAEAAGHALGRQKWFTVSWRTDQSNSIDVVAVHSE
jgi:hypothetical protein